jgi:hypothetical protein
MEGNYLGVAKVTSDGEPVRAALEILALVARGEPSEDLIRLGRRLKRELGINRAAVDQERRFRLGDVFLPRGSEWRKNSRTAGLTSRSAGT